MMKIALEMKLNHVNAIRSHAELEEMHSALDWSTGIPTIYVANLLEIDIVLILMII